MSKIANRIIKIPTGVEAVIKSEEKHSLFFVTGPLGKSREIKILPSVVLKKEENKLTTFPFSSLDIPLAGTYNSLITNLIKGVSVGYQKTLEIRGVGFKVELKNAQLMFSVGKTHPVFVKLDTRLNVSLISQKEILIKGLDKETVNSFAATIKLIKKPSAYHDKGVFFSLEKKKLKTTKSISKSK